LTTRVLVRACGRAGGGYRPAAPAQISLDEPRTTQYYYTGMERNVGRGPTEPAGCRPWHASASQRSYPVRIYFYLLRMADMVLRSQFLHYFSFAIIEHPFHRETLLVWPYRNPILNPIVISMISNLQSNEANW